MPSVRAGTVLAEVYCVQRRIGKTALASVFLAVDLQLQREVAVKIVSPEYSSDAEVVAAFHREAVVMARVRHVNVVQIHALGQHHGLPFLVLEYMPGGSVAGLIKASSGRGEHVAMNRVTGILDQASRGLEAVHRKGIVHGDVKPANMLLDGRDSVTISDFGLIEALNAVESTAAGESRSFVAGTPLYIAPEMILGTTRSEQLHLCDVYSLGASLFEMLAGRGPFIGGSIEAILKRHLFDPPPKITQLRPELPSALNGVLARALDKQPQRRYPSCMEFSWAVNRAIQARAA